MERCTRIITLKEKGSPNLDYLCSHPPLYPTPFDIECTDHHNTQPTTTRDQDYTQIRPAQENVHESAQETLQVVETEGLKGS